MSDESNNGNDPVTSGRGGTSPIRALDSRYSELKAERRAALNLMEDAIEARRRADELVEQLRSEVKSRELAEAAVRESEEKYRTLFETIDEGFAVMELVLDENGTVIDIIYREANAAFEDHTGLSDVVGKRASELFPQLEEQWLDALTRVHRTGVPGRVEGFQTDLDRWFTLQYTRVGGEGSRLASAVFNDITERKNREERQTFLLRLSDALRPLADPRTVQATATRLLREQFDAGWCYYVEWNEAGTLGVVLEDSVREGLPSLAGQHDVSDAPEFLEFLRSRQMLNVPDYAGLELLTPRIRERYTALGVRAILGVPLVKGGRAAALLLLADTQEREWPESAVALIQETAERTWAAVERAKAEAALRGSEAKYRTLFDSMDEGFCIIEVLFDDAGKPYDWKFCEVNPAFGKNMGLKDAEGRTMLEMVPSIEPKWFEIYGKVALSGEPLRFVEHSAALNRWLDLYAFRVGGPNDHRIAVLFTNVTHQKETEEELRRSSERMRLLIEGATDVSIFTTDTKGIINSWNPGSERIYGYAEDEIIGRDVAILFTDEDRKSKAHIREMKVATEDGRAHDERWHMRKDGTTFYASGLTQPIGESGVEGFVKIARDMTDQIRAAQAQREKELMQSLVAAQEAVRKQIARDLHDELGQQLTALRLKLDHVSSEAPEPLCERVNEVQEIAKSIDEGVDFLAWELRPAALDDLGLVPALERYVKEWSNYSGVTGNVSASAAIERRFEPAIETALYRIVQEALNNVHKHADAHNAEVTLRLRRGKLLLIVDDDGKGFDPKDASISGRGIGLIGMKERVQMIGGSIDIESEVGHGTTLYVKAPVNGYQVQPRK